MKKHFSTILLVVIFILGLGIMLYPAISNYINEKNQSYAIVNYENALQDMKEEDFEAYFLQAEAYNIALNAEKMAFYNPKLVEGYNEALNIDGTGTMGYINIPAINVMLPIYHGTDERTLQNAAGHLEGSSLPTGGASRHAVISAHRGLPSAKLFTNLDKLVVGDRFTLTILNKVLTYEVDQIAIVLPSETGGLQVQEGKDLCTLITCTPYGINTHRLLVRGKRVENEVEKKAVYVPADAIKIDPVIVTPIMAIPFLLILLVILLVRYRKKGNEKKNE